MLRDPTSRLLLPLAMLLLLARPAAAGLSPAPVLDVEAARALLASGTPIRIAVWLEGNPADVGRSLARHERPGGRMFPTPRPEYFRTHQDTVCPSGAEVAGTSAGWTDRWVLLRIDTVESLDRLLLRNQLSAPAVVGVFPSSLVVAPVAPPEIVDPGAQQSVPVPLPASWEPPAFDCRFARVHRDALFLYGDWGGDGVMRVGKYVPQTSLFLLDANGNGVWDGPAGGDVRAVLAPGAGPGQPIVGDWNGDGRDGIGKVVQASRFLLDANENGVWDGRAGGDRLSDFAPALDQAITLWSRSSPPMIGDWNGDGADEIGRFAASWNAFLLDANGNGAWDGPAGGDRRMDFGPAGPQEWLQWHPFAGDWNGDGVEGVGQARRDRYLVDLDENDVWDGPPVDMDLAFLRLLAAPVGPIGCTMSIPPHCW